MIATIEESGHATAEVLIDIARALGESPVKLFILAGWLDPEGVGITLSSQDRHLIEKWRRLPHRDQEVLERMISGLLETTDE